MREDFIHYLWLHKKLDVLRLRTTIGECIEIVDVGKHNQCSGPDFFNGQLRIGNQLWAGNIEMHLKSSDWFAHGHEKDAAYDNVILHVVYEYDADVFRNDGTMIPTLDIQTCIGQELLRNYYKLFSSKQKWINCEEDINAVDKFILSNWQERLYVQRLERKSQSITNLLRTSKNDWEAVLFKLLAKNFGLNVNGDAFNSIACSMRFSVVRKTCSRLNHLEALFFGQAKLLNGPGACGYYDALKSDYRFLRQKFGLDSQGVINVQFFRLRPSNFPTIRLSQLANLYHLQQHLFSKVISAKHLDEMYALFEVETSPFWKTHYTFDKVSKRHSKKMTKAFIDLLLINTVLPVKFYYAKLKSGRIDEKVLDIIRTVSAEKNTIVDGFRRLKLHAKSALESQAFIQLKTEYCDKNKCLHCAVGNALLAK